MENSNPVTPQSKEEVKCVVLRWGHRPQRDVRLTTHVALTARALCASGFILSDVIDQKIEETVMKITRNWGGEFYFEMGDTLEDCSPELEGERGNRGSLDCLW